MSDQFDPDKVFHTGEIALQERIGAHEKVKRMGSRMVRPFMPDQHRAFFEMLPFVVLGLLDDHGRPWATLSFGEPGFMRSPDDRTLEIGAGPLLGNDLGLALAAGDKIGLLGIELPTRRRNRMNGVIREAGPDGVVVHVDQSFGNCPQYIQTRDIQAAGNGVGAAVEAARADRLTPEAKAVIERVDTFFIASRTKELNDDPRTGVDASHRGGRPGFVKVLNDQDLVFPDFSGNRIFNTLGNIEDDGRVGLVFTDFETGDAVFLTGSANIVWDEARVALFAGAERLVEVHAEEVVTVSGVLPMTGDLIELSPRLAGTGSWRDTPAA